MPVPFSKQKDTIASLTALEQSIAQGKSGLTLTFSVAGTQVSTPLLQSQTCSLTDLFSSAQAQAQKIAAASGVTFGTVLALSSASSEAVGARLNANLVGYVAAASFVSPTYAPPCGLTVKFSLMSSKATSPAAPRRWDSSRGGNHAKKRPGLWIMLSCSPAFGQLDSNSITVYVARSSNVQPDQVVFAINVQSGVNTSLDDVIAPLQGSGITAANFISVNTSYS